MSAASPAPISQPYLLLGEGTGENAFFRDLLEEMGINGVQIESYGGKDKLAAHLKGLRIRTGFDQVRRLAITRDADENPGGADASVKSAVTNAGFPAEMVVSHFILPGGGRKGALESLWLETLSGDPLAECVDGFFECLTQKQWEPSQHFSKADKARAQVWLATKSPPNEAFHRASRYGRGDKAAAGKWVDFGHAAFAPLKNFLRAAFS